MATDQASLHALCPGRERLVRIATMIRDVERSTPVVGRQTRRGREARLIPPPSCGVTVAFPGPDSGVVGLASQVGRGAP